MIPRSIRNRVFDQISGVTMRPFFNPVGLSRASGLARDVLRQSQRDFFINGTITSHAACPQLMAGMWIGGREIALTNGYLRAWFKKAMGAALSEVNECPYCEDMLLSLTRGAKAFQVADSLERNAVDEISDEQTRSRLEWVKGSVSRSYAESHPAPFSIEELPEALGTLVVFNYTNKISDFTMDGSPVPSAIRGGALKAFGMELRESSAMDLDHRLSLPLLPSAALPGDLLWASGNSLVAESLARWNRAVEVEIDHVLSPDLQQFVRRNLAAWRGEAAPLSRAWVEDEVADLSGAERDMVRLVLLVAKASYQVDGGVIAAVAHRGVSEADLVRLGSWAAFNGATTVTGWSVPETLRGQNDPQRSVQFAEATIA